MLFLLCLFFLFCLFFFFNDTATTEIYTLSLHDALPIGAALTTTMRATCVACIACTMARVPCAATPASAFDRAPRPESTASAPATADSSTAGSAAARSAATMRNLPASPGQVLGVPDDCCDVVACGEGLLEELSTDAAGRREDRELHLSFPALFVSSGRRRRARRPSRRRCALGDPRPCPPRR